MLDSIDAIIEAFGGRQETLKALDVASTTISSWKGRGIPPARYVQIREALKKAGAGEPSPELFHWGRQ